MKGFLLIFLASLSCWAQMVSIPEDCLTKKISPCLIRAETPQSIQIPLQNLSIKLKSNTIFKVLHFESEPRFELLQGAVQISELDQKNKVFYLNQVHLESKQIFSEREAQQLKIYDVRHFILSDYQVTDQADKENVIVKADFLNKKDMIKFITNYITEKKVLLEFLKAIEKDWQKEFKILTDNQTKVIKRSVASIENDEKAKARRKQQEIEELKKVRELFFYRTFYR